MRIGSRVMMALYSFSLGLHLYFGSSELNVSCLKLDGYIYLVIAVILIGSCFSYLPAKMTKKLIIYSLVFLELMQCQLLIHCDWASAGIELIFVMVFTILILILFARLLIDSIKQRASHSTHYKRVAKAMKG